MQSTAPEIEMRALKSEEIRAYREDGVACLRKIYSPIWVDGLRSAFEKLKAKPGPFARSYQEDGIEGEFFFDVDVWTRMPEFRDYVFRSPSAVIAGKLMGARETRLFYDQVFIKEPGEMAPTPWHQDQPYWRVDGRQVCTIWLPLDPVPRSIGVEFVKGSHLSEVMYSPTTFSKDHSLYDGGLPPVPDIDANRGNYDIVSWDVEPGDCLVFQAKILHGAKGGVKVSQRRRALATRWCGDDARYVIRANKTNIPTQDPGLKDGDAISGPQFPLIWSDAQDGKI